MTTNESGPPAKGRPANLQSPRPLTIKQAAELMNVSERSVYMARAVMKLRPALGPQVEAGKMSLNEAHRIATRRRKPTAYDRLAAAWRAASEDDHARFLVALRLTSYDAATS